MGPPITLLYVPADRPDRIPKACASGADAVIVDLEDAVVADHKIVARENVEGAEAFLAPGQSLQIRINASGTRWHEGDLEAVAALPADVGIRVPKVEDAAAVRNVRDRVGGRPIHALVETAVGLRALDEICSAGVAGVGLGEADLRSELGVLDGPGIDWLRMRLVVAARAAGLPAPSMSAYPRLGDESALVADCRRGRSCGQVGRSAIHPHQLPAIRRAFRPDDAEYERAQALLSGLEQATDAGSGVIVLADGRFADRAMVNSARTTVDLRRRLADAH